MMDSRKLSEWQGYLTLEEVDLLKVIAGAAGQLSPEPVIINIGAGAGTSAFSFLEGAPNARVFSVDIRADEAENMTNEHLRLKEAGEDYQKRAIRIWGDSKLVGRAWPSKYPVDVLFIDGDHSDSGVRGDTIAWERHVRTGGWVIFHDYGSNSEGIEPWPAVRAFVDEWSLRKGVFRGVARAGTTLVFRKNA